MIIQGPLVRCRECKSMNVVRETKVNATPSDTHDTLSRLVCKNCGRKEPLQSRRTGIPKIYEYKGKDVVEF